MSTIINRPINWNGVSEVFAPQTGETIGWVKRKAGNAGRTAFDAYLNTQTTFRDAEYIGTTATLAAAVMKVRFTWSNQDTEVLV